MAFNTNTTFTMTADGTSDGVPLFTQRPLSVEAVFDNGTGTIKLQSKVGDGEIIDVPDCSFTASGRANVAVNHEFGEVFYANLASSGGSPSIRLIVTELQGAN